jgi:hypothetical protein
MNKRGFGGFALPTVLVASMIMLVVLLSAVSSTAAVRGAIIEQYYNQMSRSAADSGLVYAQACLEAGGVTWSDSSPLGPNTDCAGVQLAGFDCTATPTDPKCVVSVNDNIVSTFSVMAPEVDGSGEITKISSKGITSILRSSDNTPRRQFSHTSQLVVTDVSASAMSGDIKVLVVAGGGGGGGQIGGGGGGGGVIYKPSLSVALGQSINVTVGSGGASAGAGTTNQGSTGNDSRFGTIVAKGGGGGGGNVASAIGSGLNGGSGGGEAQNAYGIGLGTAGQGNNGGIASNLTTAYGSGGGGGATAVGGNGTSTAGGVGGAGYTSYILGSAVTYGGGGGGAVNAGVLPGNGGVGGGGKGGITGGANAVAGTANTGGGGGGNNATSTGSGGSGVVIVSYPTGSLTATGGTITTSGGNTIHTFTSGSSNFTVTSIGSWRYKRELTVTSGNVSSYNNYQVQVNPFTDASLLNNTGLVGSWHFNEDSGVSNSTAYDMSGNGNHGSMSTANYRTTSGRFGDAFTGDGTAQNKVLIPASSSINMTTSLSIEAWIHPAVSAVKEIVGRMNSGGTAPVSYELFQNNQKISFRLFKSATAPTWTTNTDMTLNAWHHVVATWDGAKAYVYVDGKLDMTPQNYAAPIDSSPTIGLAIGGYGNNTYLFNGKIDEVKLYNRALTGPATNCTTDSSSEVCIRYGALGVPKIRSDYGDIRFTNADGTANYPYWQETDGKFWVKITNLPVGDTKINMYYGNANASSASNGDDTFAFFDDFNGSVIDTAKWAELDAKGAIAQGNGLVLTSITDVWDSGLISKAKFNRTAGLAVGGSFKAGPSVTAPCYMMIGWDLDQEATASYTQLVHGLYFQAGNFTNVYETASAYATTGGTYAANSVNLFDVKLKSIGANYYNNGTALYTATGKDLTTSPMRIAIQQRNHIGTINYIYVRQGSPLEPTSSSPAAETLLFKYDYL